ncbi:MAG: hypothetical protein IT449_18220 [Phycisphaerales bacterium]|nr:hypothetical protein [Phycisphaerales bacterium]
MSTPDAEGTSCTKDTEEGRACAAASPSEAQSTPAPTHEAPTRLVPCAVKIEETDGAERIASLWLAWLPGMLMPHRLAARMAPMRLRRLVPFHVLSVVALAAALLLAVDTLGYSYAPWTQVLGRASKDCEDFVSSVATDRWGWLGLLVCVAGCEAAVAALALVVAAWGARDEPWRRSFRNAWRAVWIALPAAIPMILAPTVLGHELARLASQRDRNAIYQRIQWPTAPDPPKLPPMNPQGRPEWREFQEAFARYTQEMHAAEEEYNRQYEEWLSEALWFQRHHEETTAAMFFLAGAMFIVQLLRTVAAPRLTPAIARPGMCEFCGYNLATIPMESRCPECGAPVLASLGEDVRPGSPWEHRTELGRCRAWATSCLMAILHPGKLGRLIRATVRPTGLLPFLTVHAAVILPVAALSVFCTIAWQAPGNVSEDELVTIATVGVCFGLFCGALSVLASTFMAHVVGVILGMSLKRNLMPAAMQMGVYLMGYVVLWATAGAAWTSLTIAMLTKEAFRDFARSLGDAGSYGELYALIFWATPNVAAFVLYVSLLVRGTSAARYANR